MKKMIVRSLAAVGMMVLTACGMGGNQGATTESAAETTVSEADLMTTGAVEAAVEGIYRDVYAKYREGVDAEAAKSLCEKYMTEEMKAKTVSYIDWGWREPWFCVLHGGRGESYEISIGEGKLESVKVVSLTSVPEKKAVATCKVGVNDVEKEIELTLGVDEGAKGKKEWKVSDIRNTDYTEGLSEMIDMDLEASRGGDGDYVGEEMTIVKTAEEFFQTLKDGELNIGIQGTIDIGGEDGEAELAKRMLGEVSGFDEEKESKVTMNFSDLTFYRQTAIRLIGIGEDACITTSNPSCIVLAFRECSDIEISNLNIGHQVVGGCEAGVVALNRCKDVSINRCGLNGCGTEGLVVYYSEGVNVYNTKIYHCSEAGFFVDESTVSFTNCDFTDMGGVVFTAAVAESEESDITLENCYVYGNMYGREISYEEGDMPARLIGDMVPLKMKNCLIYHPSEQIGSKEEVVEEGCKWIDALDGVREEGIGTDW